MSDNSAKSILARGCDVGASLAAAQAIPPLIGSPEYVPTTTDEEFIDRLQSRSWSVVFFAPGACRFSAAKKPIPGSNVDTAGWTLEQYRQLVLHYQGESVQIVETVDERDAVDLLASALEVAPATG